MSPLLIVFCFVGAVYVLLMVWRRRMLERNSHGI